MNTCVCVICFKPDDIWINFLNTFVHYDIFLIIDDNRVNYKDIYKDYIKINFIQIPNAETKAAGFIKTDFDKNGHGWSKALYYFSSINTRYTKVWFLEYDVFLYNENTLLNIDSKYIESDLLSNSYGINATGHKNSWHWPRIDIKIPPPYYSCMCCAVRMSQILLSKIKDYATKYNTLFFHEALTPTMCNSNNLLHDTPDELKNIVYSKEYKYSDINKINLYHPVKNLKDHLLYRNQRHTTISVNNISNPYKIKRFPMKLFSFKNIRLSTESYGSKRLRELFPNIINK